MVADGDGDGRQEIIQGGATIGPDGKDFTRSCTTRSIE
jgi:hypothetical protein